MNVRLFLAALAVLQLGGAGLAADTTYSDFTLELLDRPAQELRRLGFARHDLGELFLPSGRIVATDPLTLFSLGSIASADQPATGPALSLSVEPGRYRIRTVTSFAEGAEDRVALVELIVAPGPVASWTASEDRAGGAGVDAGLASFMSLEAYEHLTDVRSGKTPGIDDYYGDVLAEELKMSGPDMLMHVPPLQPRGQTLNVAIFHSGWGDGYYPVLEGHDDDGRLLRLAMSFFVGEQVLMELGGEPDDVEPEDTMLAPAVLDIAAGRAASPSGQ